LATCLAGRQASLFASFSAEKEEEKQGKAPKLRDTNPSKKDNHSWKF